MWTVAATTGSKPSPASSAHWASSLSGKRKSRWSVCGRGPRAALSGKRAARGAASEGSRRISDILCWALEGSYHRVGPRTEQRRMVWTTLLPASPFTVLASPGTGASPPEVGQSGCMAAEADSSRVSTSKQFVAKSQLQPRRERKTCLGTCDGSAE